MGARCGLGGEGQRRKNWDNCNWINKNNFKNLRKEKQFLSLPYVAVLREIQQKQLKDLDTYCLILKEI